ncbi:DUF7345 domain-containing protein [Natronomonas marina]|jgi:hypothetical protein|uniref:DUF7345 domain-containing protein n=1 Tax=Natronomonas marina TaxID=2961939 RepID=UPI0020C972CF|nr:hypothetical protein [Natronomonas marina]
MRRALAALAVVTLCLSVAVGVGAAAHEEPERSLLGIELEADGNATVYYVNAFDLSAEEGRTAYESYTDNESRRAAFRAAVVAELRGAAENASEEAGWETRVHNVSVRTYEQGDYGRVEVRADWQNLAYADRRKVIVAQPFRAGYEPNREVAVHGPEGYRRNRTAPSPLRARQNSVLLNPMTSDFSGFFAEFVDPDAPTATPTETPTPAGGGGGGTTLVLQALLLAVIPAALVVLAIRRRE